MHIPKKSEGGETLKTSKEMLIEAGYNPVEVNTWSEEECESELSYASEGQDII